MAMKRNTTLASAIALLLTSAFEALNCQEASYDFAVGTPLPEGLFNPMAPSRPSTPRLQHILK